MLLQLPLHVLGRLWPADRALIGLRVCRLLHDRLLSHMENVSLRVCKRLRTLEAKQGLFRLLQRVNGKVQMCAFVCCNVEACRDAMRGKVDELVLTSSGRRPCTMGENDALAVQACLPGLRKLALCSPYYDGDAIALVIASLGTFSLANPSELQEFALNNMRIESVANWHKVLAALRFMSALRSLQLQFVEAPRLDAARLSRALAALSCLQELDLDSLCMQGGWRECMRGLQPPAGGPLPALTALALTNMKLATTAGDDNAFCAFLVGLSSSLQRINLHMLRFSQRAFVPRFGEALSRMPALVELDIAYMHCPSESLQVVCPALNPWLARCAQLRSLTMTGICMDTDGVVALCNSLAVCPCLETLNLSQNMSEGERGAAGRARRLSVALSALPALRELYLQKAYLSQTERAEISARLPTRAVCIF